MVLLLTADLSKLCVDSIVVGWSLHVADHAEGDGETIFGCHHGEFQLQGVIFTVGIMHKHIVDGIAILTDLYHLQAEALLHETELIVLTKHEFLAMLYINGILLTTLVVVYDIVAVVVEDHTVLQDLTDRSTLVLIGSLQNLHRSLGIGSHGTGEEVSTGTEAEFGRTEGILNCTVRTRLRHEATGRGGRILALRQTVDTVVEQDHVQVDVTTVGMDEVVTTDSQSVTVARHLPDGEVGISHLRTSSDGGSTTMNGVHAVGSHIVRQTARAADTTDHCNILGSHADLSHGLMERCQEEVVTATRTPTRLSFLKITCTVVTHILFFFLPRISLISLIILFDKVAFKFEGGLPEIDKQCHLTTSDFCVVNCL